MSSTTNRLGLRRKLLLGSSVFMMAALLAVGAASCGAALPDVQPGQCGNYVVEPDNGEACDDRSPKCGQPWEIGACRELCIYGGAPDEQCKPGFGCGLDGVCRKSDGLALLPISIAGGDIQKLLRGDFDGDGRDDVVAVGYSAADIHFLTTEGYVDQTVTLPNEQGLPAVGDINADELSDIVLSLGYAVGVLLGQPAREFQSENYPTMYVEPQTYRLVPVGVTMTHSGVLALRKSGGKTYFDLVELLANGGHDVKQVKPLAMPNNPAASIDGDVEGAIATRQSPSTDQLCAAIAFEATGPTPMANNVYIAKGCGAFFDYEPYSLKGQYPWGGAYFEDVDNSGTTDLIYGSGEKSGVIAKLEVIKTDANGEPIVDMNGNIVVSPLIGFERGNCNNSAAEPAKLASAPLAIGDLNGDGYADFVDNRGVVLQDPTDVAQPFKRTCHDYYFQDSPMPPPFREAWSKAVLGDFNGDGRKDVLAARRGDAVIDLWTWQPEGFKTIPIFVGAPVAELVAGDFDGDNISDAVYRLLPPPEQPDAAPTFALFGNHAASPSTPQPLGELHDIAHLATGRFHGLSQSGESDVLSDLLILSSNDDPNVRLPLTLFQGNSTRNLVSPLTPQEDTTSKDALLSTEPINSIAISDFAWDVCDRYPPPLSPSDPPLPHPANVIAVGDSKIWFAGCDATGSSMPIADMLGTTNFSLFFAPVERSPAADAMAIFLGQTSPDKMLREVKFGIIERKDGAFSNSTLGSLTTAPADIVLPMKEDLKNGKHAPYIIEDLDRNGFKDVVLIGQPWRPGENLHQRNIYVFWNGNGQVDTGTLMAEPEKTLTTFNFTLALDGDGIDDDGDGKDNEGSDPSPLFDIQDIAALNIDGDAFLELAIVTRNALYFAKLTTVADAEDKTATDVARGLAEGRPFQLLAPPEGTNERQSGGQALLALDADSDGIDDLLVADMGSLQLYLGTERLR